MNNSSISSLRIRSRHFTAKRGQAIVEYALILSVISVLTIFVMSALGVEIQGVYMPIINALEAARQSIQ